MCVICAAGISSCLDVFLYIFNLLTRLLKTYNLCVPLSFVAAMTQFPHSQ